MNNLVQLARIVTSRGLTRLPLLRLEGGGDTKEKQLMQTLVETPDATQSTLVQRIYGSNTPATVEAYYQLRSRLQVKLLNHLYFLDFSDARHLVGRRCELSILSSVHQATVLIEEGEFALAEHMLTRGLRQARQDDFTHYGLLAARHLRNLYVLQRKGAKYRRMVQELAWWRQRHQAESEAEDLYAEFRMAAGGAVAAQRRLLPQLPEYIERLEALHQQAGSSFGTFFFVYRARLYTQQMHGNFEEIIRLTTEAACLAASGGLNARRFDQRYNHFMMAHGYLGARRAGEGLALARQHLLDFHPSSNGWFSYQENHLLLALHSGAFDRARQVYEEVTLNEAYDGQRASDRQRWELYRAYLDVLVLPPARLLRQPAAQWALALPDFNRDKLGYHVAALIIQLLYFLHRRNLDEVALRLERLRKYRQLHLQEAETLRSRLFLKLLALLHEEDFNPRTCAERGAPLVEKLTQAPVPGEAFAEMEVVPYECLWQLTLDALRQGPRLTARAS